MWTEEEYAWLLVCGVIEPPVRKRIKVNGMKPKPLYVPTKRVIDPVTRRNTYLKFLYGLTIDQYDALLESQGGHCAICPSTKRLCVDHDHACCPDKRSCGKCVRGILCSRCNTMLGYANDSSDKLKAAAEYLDMTRCRA